MTEMQTEQNPPAPRYDFGAVDPESGSVHADVVDLAEHGGHGIGVSSQHEQHRLGNAGRLGRAELPLPERRSCEQKERGAVISRPLVADHFLW